MPRTRGIFACAALFAAPSLSLVVPTRPVHLRTAWSCRRPTRPLKMVQGDLFDKLPDERVVRALERCKPEDGKLRVVAPDIASMAGVDLSTAQSSLTRLAALADGALEVASEGDIVYSFDRGFRGTLLSRSTKQRLKDTWLRIWPTVFKGIRVSFGAILIVSIVAIFATIVFISSASSSSDDDNRRGRSSPMRSGYNDFYFFRMGSDPYGGGGGGGLRAFFEATFSYVFGVADPNAGISEARLQNMAAVIRRGGGAVAAEQLYPYVAEPPPLDTGGRTVVDENYVLPAVLALDGRPDVTEDGDIIYVFPELQKTAGAFGGGSAAIYGNTRGGDAALAKVDPWLEEQERPFSDASPGQQAAAAALGGLNLFGALWLRGLLASPAAALGLPGWYGAVQAFFPLLLIYAVAYNAVPLARYVLLQRSNSEVRERNQLREMWRRAVESGGGGLARKLTAARRRASEVRVLGSDDVIYSSGKSLAEQEAQDPRLEEFDKRLSR
ncbi:unnamed protein product [Phaeothamnion confervicola]